MCPSRAMLLSGNDNHIAGIGIQAFSSENFGYEGKLSERVKSFLKFYKKAVTNHLYLKMAYWGDPYERGFNNSYSLLPGAFTHYDNNKPIEAYPDSSFLKWKREYTRENIQLIFLLKMIDFIKSNHDKPCLLIIYSASLAIASR